MTPEIEAQLSQLRDIRLPEQVGWWPLALGWWLVLAVILAALVGALAWLTLRKRSTRYLALRELETLNGDDPRKFATELSVLLRRVARRKDATAAHVSGAGWADYLSRTGFTSELATYLANATYAPLAGNTPKATRLKEAAAHWIKRQS